MEEAQNGNAMTEIALALAMGFFSIMVLTMVSMTTGSGEGKSSAVSGVNLEQRTADAAKGSVVTLNKEDTFIVFSGGRFFNRDLKLLNPDTLKINGRALLALAPDASLADAVSARGKISAKELIVTTLDPTWIAALKRVER